MGTVPRRLGCLSAFVGAIVMPPCSRVFAAVPMPAPALLSMPAACSVSAPTSFRPNSSAVATRAAQVTRNDRADLTFEVRPVSTGALLVQAVGGELVIRKTVEQSGSWTLELQARNDRVAVSVAEQAIRIMRGRKSISLTLETATDEQLTDVRRMLADSRAVALFRAAGAAIEASEDDAGPALAMLMADSLVGALTGDVGAPRRIARHLARHALSRARRIGMAGNCYAFWEAHVMAAWTDYVACLSEVSPWAPLQLLCAARWSLMVESYWWQFLTCASFPF